MNSDYLKAFITGSSYLTLLQFFLAVMKIPEEVKNYSYENYTLVAPLYLGIMNMLGLWLSRQLGLEGGRRYFIIGLISGLIVPTFATWNQSYNYTQARWLQYYLYIIFKHVVTFYVIIQILDLSI